MLSAAEASKILGKDVSGETLEFDSPVLPDPEIVLVYNNPEYIPHFQGKDYCYAMVHGGYSITENNGLGKDLIKDKKKYGDYSIYSTNFRRLNQRLGNSNELVLHFVDNYCFRGNKGDVYPPGFLPYTSNLILVTDMSDFFGEGIYEEKIWTTDHRMILLNHEKIYPFLKEINVKTILLAGEWVHFGTPGCLGTVAEKLKDEDFDVKGVKGCLYPSVPKLDTELLRKLYQEQVDPAF
jgi:hypothetical protein